MNELFGKPQIKKQSEYQKAYAMVYSFTNNKKLQDKLLEYVDFRIKDCSNKGYRFYSSSIKSFLDSIDTQMRGASADEIWEALNVTLSYPSIRLLVPFKNKKKTTSLENFKSPDIKSDGLNHNKATDEDGNPITF